METRRLNGSDSKSIQNNTMGQEHLARALQTVKGSSNKMENRKINRGLPNREVRQMNFLKRSKRNHRLNYFDY